MTRCLLGSQTYIFGAGMGVLSQPCKIFKWSRLIDVNRLPLTKGGSNNNPWLRIFPFWFFDKCQYGSSVANFVMLKSVVCIFISNNNVIIEKNLHIASLKTRKNTRQATTIKTYNINRAPVHYWDRHTLHIYSKLSNKLVTFQHKACKGASKHCQSGFVSINESDNSDKDGYYPHTSSILLLRETLDG